MANDIRGSGFLFDKDGGDAWWPTGKFWLAYEDLAAHLANAAEWHASSALSSLASDDEWAPLTAATSAGAAVELVAKSVLADVTPTLLGEKGAPESLIPLARVRADIGLSKTKIKTLSLSQALILVKRLHPTFSYAQRPDDVFLRVRNAATHMALVDPSELGQAIEQLVTLADELVALSPWPDRARFWGPQLQTANTIADRTQREYRARLESRLVAAREHLARITAGLTKAQRDTLFAALPPGATRMGTDRQIPTTCPVCEQLGTLGCMVSDQTEEVETPEGTFTHVLDRLAYGVEFACGVCQVRLEGLGRFQAVVATMGVPG